MSKKEIELADEARRARLEKLNETKVVFPVTTLKQVNSQETLNYCLMRLQEGVQYDQLRRELGLGPAFKDKRWLRLRSILVNHILPKDEESALLQARDETEYWIKQLESMVSDLDERISEVQKVGRIFDENTGRWKLADSSMLAAMQKTKLDTIKTLIEVKKKFFSDYLEIQTLRRQEKKTGGVSITIVNQIPRPENRLKDVQEAALKTAINVAKVVNDD